ncbi:hypothetical protein NYE48_01575 [Paenibacillus sp. FSL M7-1455]|uniref:hypothetical protein n=1 Tax=Paenibacillus sp. FSL M7-1455 TaxID=2975316 RepID=UPI0030FBE866
MDEEFRDPEARFRAALKKTCRITGLVLFCWCVLFACSEAAVLAFDIIAETLAEWL